MNQDMQVARSLNTHRMSPSIHGSSVSSLLPSQEARVKGKRVLGRISTRLALFLCASSLFAYSLVFMAVGWTLVDKIYNRIPELQQTAIFVHVLAYTVLVFFCIFGIFASIKPNRKYSSMFSAMILGQILISIGSGALCLFVLFHSSTGENVDECMAAAPRTFLLLKEFCQRTPLAKGLSLNMFFLMWALQALTFYAGIRNTSYLQSLVVRDLEAEYYNDDGAWDY